jgi:hypothetical protein
MPYPVNAANLRACAAIFKSANDAEKVPTELLKVVGQAVAEANLLPEGNISEDLQAILNGMNDASVKSDTGIAECLGLFGAYFDLRARAER